MRPSKSLSGGGKRCRRWHHRLAFRSPQENALRVGAVVACVKILAETVSTLPLGIYRREEGSRAAVDHPLNALLGASPNGEQTAMEAREFQMYCLGFRGNAYSQILRTNGGRVGAIQPLNAGYMNVDRDASQRLVFDYNEPGNTRVYPASQIWRIAGFGSDGVTGLSPISLARESIGLSIAAEQTAGGLFKRGFQGSLALEFPHEITPEQIVTLRDQFESAYGGSGNSGKPLILESGMKANSIGMSADDAQFLESRKWQVQEIARWFRIPPHMIGDLEKATFSNIEHQSIDFVVHTIRPWLVRIEQSIARDLLTPAEQRTLFAAHKVEGLLRGDTQTRYEAYGKAIQDGWMSRNEVRVLENRQPGPDDLNEFLLPLNMGTSSEREQAMTQEASNRLAAAEALAVRTEYGRLSLEAFANWLPNYYTRHAKAIAKQLAIPFDAANEYGQSRIKQFIETEPEALIDAIEATAGEDIKALCNG